MVAKIIIVEKLAPRAVVCGGLMSIVSECKVKSVEQGLLIDFKIGDEDAQLLMDQPTHDGGRLKQVFIQDKKIQNVYLYFV